jgi:hypothetical protein
MRIKGKFSGVRKAAGVMNQTETRYAELLRKRQLAGEIESFTYETLKVKVADGSWYCPDFMVIRTNHIEFHEVKGSYMLDRLGHSKLKQAADKYPEFRWVMQVYKNKKIGFEKVYDNMQ